jgi:hypothetical protein
MWGHVADWLGVMARWTVDRLRGDGTDLTPAVGGALCVAVLLGFFAIWAVAEALGQVAAP